MIIIKRKTLLISVFFFAPYLTKRNNIEVILKNEVYPSRYSFYDNDSYCKNIKSIFLQKKKRNISSKYTNKLVRPTPLSICLSKQ